MTPTRPVMRYHGGKWMLAPWIVSHFPPHRVYVEPFCGACTVLFHKPRTYAEVVSDLDGEIVNVFQVLRDRTLGAQLERQLRLTPFARAEFVQSYETAVDPVEQARHTILRSFMGWGSPAASGGKTGFRSNSHRSGTTPARDWGNFPESIAAFVDRMQGVVVECRDALELMPQHDGPETLFYCDPPYPLATRKIGNPYCKKGYRHEMTDDDHRRLAEVLRSVVGAVVLSGYACDLYDQELYGDWHRAERPALADGARPRTEVLWMNEAAVAGRRQLRLEGVA